MVDSQLAAGAIPERLSRDRILTAALAIADRDGLDSASLRKVAAHLDVHVTSLYNYLPTKDALLDAIGEELFEVADVPTGDLQWADWVRGFVDAINEMARTHPGAFAVLLRRPVQGSAAARTFEAGLTAFRRAGMDVEAAYSAVKSVALAALGCCIEQAYAVTGAELRTDLRGLPQGVFPMLHETDAVADDVDVVSALRDVLIAGFDARLRGTLTAPTSRGGVRSRS